MATSPTDLKVRAVRLKDVAERSGTNLAAVSMVLNGARSNSGVSASSREKILQVALELGYRPNAAAKAVSTGRFGALGLLQPASWESVHAGLLIGIQTAVFGRNLHLSVASVPEAHLVSDDFVPKLLGDCWCDGLLINYINNPAPRMAALIARHAVPAIWMNARLDAHCVHPDDERAAFDATERLLHLGHTRVLFAGALSPHYSALDRERGFRRAMERARLEARVETFELYQPARQAVEAAKSALLAHCSTAVLAYDGHIAHPFYGALLELGWRVPERVSLVSFDETPLDFWGVQIASMRIPMRTMGEESVRLLLQKIEAPSEEIAPLALPLAWDEGTTCAPPLK